LVSKSRSIVINSKDSDDGIVFEFCDDDMRVLEEKANKFIDSIPDIVSSISESAATKMLRSYRRAWVKHRPYEIDQLVTFRRNIQNRWGRGFDALRMLVDLCRDVGSEFQERSLHSHSKNSQHLDKALGCLHVRAVQLSTEILTLMENGFADGAMARWRTLHEVAVVASVISDGRETLAERYLAHEAIEAKRAMEEYKKCHEMLGYPPLPKNTDSKIEKQYQAAIARFGTSFREPLGWAAQHVGNSNPKFSQLEEASGKAMMRSHYKMASYNVHASPKGISHRLGALAGSFAMIGGASNVGFVDPGQNMAISLTAITFLISSKNRDIEFIARWIAITRLRDAIPTLLAAAQRKIEREERALGRKTKIARKKKIPGSSNQKTNIINAKAP
jgi:hypothetical protein